jgi:hypothetical protein
LFVFSEHPPKRTPSKKPLSKMHVPVKPKDKEDEAFGLSIVFFFFPILFTFSDETMP